MKYWSIRSPEDTLSYYAFACTEGEAVREVEKLMGPMNPSRRIVKELPKLPAGLRLSGPGPCLLEDAPEEE